MSTSYRALPTIAIEGEPAPKDILENVLQVIVEESLHRPSLFMLVIRNDYQSGVSEDDPWQRQSHFKIGTRLSIGFSPHLSQSESASQSSESEEENSYLIEGEITALESKFSEQTQAPIVIRGYDSSHRLHRGLHNRSFQNMTDSDIVKKIAEEVQIETDIVDPSGEPHDYVFQENQSNMAFLRDRAARIGFELFVRDNKLHFHQPKKPRQELSLTWLKDVRSFHVRTTSMEQVKQVEVRGWDYATKSSIVATAQQESVITETEQEKTGSETSTLFEGMQHKPKLIVVDRPVFKRRAADDMAQAVCNQVGGNFTLADALAEGNPDIRPGVSVKLAELGPYTGQYYVTETRHIYAERTYDTEFSVRGLQSSDLSSLLTPAAHLRPGQTPLVGIVTDNEDPDGMGRIRVKLPTLTEDHNSNWARVVSIGAANSRGFDCLPEIDDEVLVAFEHGDIHRPYILGGVWNGRDAPPQPVSESVRNGQVRLRTFQTRTGHKIQFVEDDPAGVCIETAGGQRIYLNDSKKEIHLQSTGNIKIHAEQTVEIKGKLITLN